MHKLCKLLKTPKKIALSSNYLFNLNAFFSFPPIKHAKTHWAISDGKKIKLNDTSTFQKSNG